MSHSDQECPSSDWSRAAKCPLFSFFKYMCCSNNKDRLVLHDADDSDHIEFIENESSQASVVQDFLDFCGDWVMGPHFYPLLSLFYSIMAHHSVSDK